MSETREIRFQVSEVWKGTYNPDQNYFVAAVVQDPSGLSVYRSLQSNNRGHALTDTDWWFCIIDLSDIKDESERIAALSTAIEDEEVRRRMAETQRGQNETDRQTTARQDHERAQEDHRLVLSDHAQAGGDRKAIENAVSSALQAKQDCDDWIAQHGVITPEELSVVLGDIS